MTHVSVYCSSAVADLCFFSIEFVTPRNLYRYKLGKIIMTGICIGISYGK